MRLKIMQIICPITFIIGIILTLYCTQLGNDHVSTIMRENGGSMDTNKYIIYLQESIRTYRELGIALVVVSALGEIAFVNRLYNK